MTTWDGKSGGRGPAPGLIPGDGRWSDNSRVFELIVLFITRPTGLRGQRSNRSA